MLIFFTITTQIISKRVVNVNKGMIYLNHRVHKGDFLMKYFKLENLTKDIISGIIVALISIPISLGYAQVAGLPPVYGLYGAILPTLIFGLMSSSPHFVFGVDATPAALVGGGLISMGIAQGTDEAVRAVPVITIVVAAWLLVFYIIRAGKLVNYISKPVMGGFISGIGCTIILMQVPKLFGGSAGTGELFVLLMHIISELKNFNLPSLILGGSTIAIILIFKKISPKIPMPAILMAAGGLLTAVFHIDEYGIKLLPKVQGGIFRLSLPDFTVLSEHGEEIIVLAFTIALVIVAQTLLATNNYAMKLDYKINNNREVLAYSAANVSGALVGCCPTNGSVSRTGIAVQYGCRSQAMSVTSAVFMLLVLLFGSSLLAYLPVPVLTGIVICALIGITEFGIARKTWKADKQEFAIFMAAFMGVLLLGTIYGVIIGVILSFVAVIIRVVVPPKSFLGMIPGHEGLYDLSRNKNARAIENTVIYRFSGNLFFGNVNTFQNDIENAMKEDTRVVIVDARGIGNIDITAAERLVILNGKLKNRGIHFYVTEHVGAVNDQLRNFGADELFDDGVIRRTVSLALRSSGIDKPYPLEGIDGDVSYEYEEADERLAEFEWAFGEGAEEKMEQLAAEVVEKIADSGDYSLDNIVNTESNITWGRVGLFDEDELLHRLELHLMELEAKNVDIVEVEKHIEERRRVLEEKLKHLSPEALELLRKHRQEVEEHLRSHNPEYYEKIKKIRDKFTKHLI